jgi:hypothetical protein
VNDFKLWDPKEHARLLASRARRVAATWKKVRRAVQGSVAAWWSEPARALIDTIASPTVDAGLVALGDELSDLVTLQARFDAHRAGEREALADLVDTLGSRGEHLFALMPRGRLPRNPAPAVQKVLRSIQEELEARLVVQWGIDPMRASLQGGTISIATRLSPSWGGSPRSLVLGRARAILDGKSPLPPRLRFRFERGGRYFLSGNGIALSGKLGGEWSIRAPRRSVTLPARVGPWPILPVVVGEDGGKGSKPTDSAIAQQPARIALAREILAAAWPAGARTVDDFTRVIIPVFQPEVVSYSFASVPGWSYINLFHRDFVDLVDDLLHENAHHHLNHILADAPLLVGNDDELIYYSPWRETLRPLRGILHSVFTFHAGAELFRRLWRAIEGGVDLPRPFTDGERKKIAARCLEETLQVRYSLIDLEHAHRRKKLNARGFALARAIGRDMAGFASLEPALRKTIRGTRFERSLKKLEATLAERRALAARVR